MRTRSITGHGPHVRGHGQARKKRATNSARFSALFCICSHPTPCTNSKRFLFIFLSFQPHETES
uniref:Uncharacterized protein n=1 Tax=Arundo donax TaxID=35708 RepID=A0A0A9T7S1_ARUDO